MSTVIQVENLSKIYRLGSIGRGTLVEDLSRAWARLLRKPDPTAKVGGGRQARLVGQVFKALDDVSFEVKQGEVFGIVGRNGAGKSTLLKILSRVTAPTSGEVRVKGRIASLLEVGTGFNPELSGRDNIYLNGAILGMKKAEIKRKFDEIVAFSGVEEFIDTPVKRYSSGMYVRLAFAVAAHLEPEILIIDEVLAVGDAQFQKKCMGKIQDVSRGGRTVLFVSHSLSVVSSLCQRVLLLKDGKTVMDGNAEQVLAAYVQSTTASSGVVSWQPSDPASDNGRLRLLETRILCDGKVTPDVEIDKPVVVEFDFEVLEDGLNACTSIHLMEKNGSCVLATGTPSKILNRGRYQRACVFPANFLNDGYYSISLYLITDITRHDVVVRDAISFFVHEIKGREEYLGVIIGSVRPQLEWMEKALNNGVPSRLETRCEPVLRTI
jgi:lipopolysaccharide transport system ATP-binding protein